MDRIEEFQKFIKDRPLDPMPRYALAMELKNRDRLEESIQAFRELIEKFPDYPAAYYQGAMVLISLKRTDEAKEMLKAGIEAAEKKGDFHTRSEMEDALDSLD